MASWRDRLKEIDLDAFRNSRWADKSAISDKRGAFGSFDAFGNAVRITEETPAAKTEDRLSDEPDQLREWRAGIARVDRDRPPKGFPAKDWQALHHDARPFLDTWAVLALALGWTTLDVFGVHRLAPAANYAAIGLVPLLRGSVVVAMTADSATIQRGTGARLTFIRHPEHPEAVPVWVLASR